MRLEESIMHAIDGNAVLFLGAGFNSGAINFNDERRFAIHFGTIFRK